MTFRLTDNHAPIICATLIFVLVSGAANFNFGISLGTNIFTKSIFGLASVAADLIKMFLLWIAYWLWQQKQRSWSIIAALFWGSCVGFSLLSAVGFAASSRGQTVALNQTQLETRENWRATVERTSTKLEALSGHRPAALIEADISQNSVPSKIWLRTKSCRDVTISESQRACRPIFELRKELAQAKEAERLEKLLEDAQAQLSTLPVVGLESDPQSATLARISGFQEMDIRTGLALLLALIIEAGSALGYTFVNLLKSREPDVQHSDTTPIEVEPRIPKIQKLPFPATPQDAVEQWSRVRLDLDAKREIPANLAYLDCAYWCRRNNFPVITQTMFGRRFTEQIEIFGGRKERRRNCNVYIGVSLQSNPITPVLSVEHNRSI